MKKIIFFIIPIFMIATCLRAKRIDGGKIPKISKVEVRSEIKFDPLTSHYLYEYSVTNSIGNVGDLAFISLDIKNTNGSADLAAGGLKLDRHEDDKREHRDFKSEKKKLDEAMARSKKPFVSLAPVGTSVPLYWGSIIGSRGYLEVISTDDHKFLPGQSMKFNVESFGIPGIREMILEPDFWPVQKDEFDEEELKEFDEIKKKLPVHIRTIGPMAPPRDFEPSSFVVSIEDMTRTALREKWIKNGDLAKGFERKLEDAKKYIASGNNEKAVGVLKELLRGIEDQKDKGLSSEAYGLLKFNVMYLVGELK